MSGCLFVGVSSMLGGGICFGARFKQQTYGGERQVCRSPARLDTNTSPQQQPSFNKRPRFLPFSRPRRAAAAGPLCRAATALLLDPPVQQSVSVKLLTGCLVGSSRSSKRPASPFGQSVQSVEGQPNQNSGRDPKRGARTAQPHRSLCTAAPLKQALHHSVAAACTPSSTPTPTHARTPARLLLLALAHPPRAAPLPPFFARPRSRSRWLVVCASHSSLVPIDDDSPSPGSPPSRPRPPPPPPLPSPHQKHHPPRPDRPTVGDASVDTDAAADDN